jgi:hypothetical protein
LFPSRADPVSPRSPANEPAQLGPTSARPGPLHTPARPGHYLSARVPLHPGLLRAGPLSRSHAPRPPLSPTPGPHPSASPAQPAPRASPLTSGARLSAPSSPPHPRRATASAYPPEIRGRNLAGFLPWHARRDPARPLIGPHGTPAPLPSIPSPPNPSRRNRVAPPRILLCAAALTPPRCLSTPADPRKSTAVHPGSFPSSLPRSPGPTSPGFHPNPHCR